MSHLAIARKWRPQVFEDIVGQRHVTRTLQNAIRLGRVHHAFLFTGARGVGKTSAARVLARALNCEKGPAPNPCNECSSCLEMLSGSYPDVIEIDAASHNSVDDIRDLVEKARYTPQRGRLKVYIIDEVHMVTKQGFNALLKTLEEPPPHVRFILATTDPQKLLDTVISRCQRFDFKMIPVRTTFEHLKHVASKEGVAIPDGSLMTIAREGGGSMRDAQSLLDQVLSFSDGSVSADEVAEILGFIDRSILYDALEGAITGNPAMALEVLGRVRLYGYDVRAFSGQLLESVRNVLVVRLVEDAAKLMDLPDEEIGRLRDLARDRDPSLIRQQFDVLAETVDAITRSEQPMLLLETALVKMAAVRPFVPIDQLLSRLEQLERRLAQAGARGGGGGGGGGSARGELRRPPPPGASNSSFRAERAATAPPAAPKRAAPPAAPKQAPTTRSPKLPPPTPPLTATPVKTSAPPKSAAPAPSFEQAPKKPAGGGSMVSNILGYSRGDAPAKPAPAPSRTAPPPRAPAPRAEPPPRLDPPSRPEP
ncbi:MAG: DNA polymerase III subunit gamma/tau, partial [Deltaproteobacteria bacterium]|nr:DNA polymerase III subunit gamma/tau [Deltaproteobacteria bacterium]